MAHHLDDGITEKLRADARKLPALLEDADTEDEHALADAQRRVRQTLGVDQLEAYYGLILMDGDRMGQMLSGDPQWAISYRESSPRDLLGDCGRTASCAAPVDQRTC